MVVTLNKWVSYYIDKDDEDYNPVLSDFQYLNKNEFTKTQVRLDKIDAYSLTEDEIVLIISGTEYFFEYNETGYNKIIAYFNAINTHYN